MSRSELRNMIRGWADRDDWADVLVDSWIEMARQDLSRRLRVADMVQIDVATVNQNRVKLPTDWQHSDFVWIPETGEVLEYKDRDTFYKSYRNNPKFFTTSGLFLQLGGTFDITGKVVELHYFGDIPQIPENESNWLMERFLEVALMRSLMFASVYGLEDQRAVGFEALVEARVTTANEAYQTAKTSGSTLFYRPKRGLM